MEYFSYVSFVMRELKIILILILIGTDRECKMRIKGIELKTPLRVETIY